MQRIKSGREKEMNVRFTVFLIIWIILNITSSFQPVELMQDFYAFVSGIVGLVSMMLKCCY